MHFIDEITCLHDAATGSIVLFVPSPIVFDSVDEFSFFIASLSSRINAYAAGDDESAIDNGYASEVIETWNQQIHEKLETPGPLTQEKEL